MLRYYKNSIVTLLSQLKDFNRNPLRSLETCLSIQLQLVNKIEYVENRIRKLNDVNKMLKRQLSKKRHGIKDKKDSKKIRDLISDVHDRKNRYYDVLHIYRAIGDGIVFALIDKWDIKPFSFKEDCGFISGKKGKLLEQNILKELFSQGYNAILNDITSVLRHGDITIPNQICPIIIEAKSSKFINRRGKRQEDRITRIIRYLLDDKIDKLYQTGYGCVRVGYQYPEKNYMDDLNNLIDQSKANGYAFKKIENGLWYFVVWKLSGLKDLSKDRSILSQIDSANSIWFILNELRYFGHAYYPFTLSIRSPEDVYSFYENDLLISVVIDSEVIRNIFLKRGYNCEMTNDDWMFNISLDSSEQETKPQKLMISKHFFLRVAFEFLSLDWILRETVGNYERVYQEGRQKRDIGSGVRS